MKPLKVFIDVKTGEYFFARTIKELRSKIDSGGSSVHKMYVDGKDGQTYHVGYVVGKHWLQMFEEVCRVQSRTGSVL